MAENTVSVPQNIAESREAQLPTTREESRYLIPPVDIFEDADGLTVVADMPGVDRAGVDIRVDNGILTIQGKVTQRSQGNGVYNEFILLDYFRQFQLGDRVDVEKIAAQLKNGVLTIHLPRMEEAKPLQIQVKVE